MDEAYPLLQLPLWIDLLAIGSGALAGAANALRERFDIIGVLLIAILFAFALHWLGERGKPLLRLEIRIFLCGFRFFRGGFDVAQK